MNHLATLPLLEVLRPPPGWRTDRALLSAYSAEPAVLVALLLALTGRDDDAGSGSRVALARAFTDLRERVAFIVQRGRLASPRKTPNVLALLDRFVREVPWDEGDADGTPGRSWHAKLALVRMIPVDDDDGPAHWRFWLGSRNFTRDTSWDIGLSLESILPGSTGGQSVPGIELVARRLAEQANEVSAWRPLLSELTEMPWNVPQGLDVRKISLMLPEDADRGLPDSPSEVSRLFAVAPFLDSKTIRQLRAWADQTHTLLSIIPELERLVSQSAKPLDGFELLALPDAPEEGEAPPEEDTATLDASIDARGLHAKFLWVEHAGGATLWLGSPNLTQRAWQRNAEAFVEIGVDLRGGAQAAKSLYEGLEAFRGNANLIHLEDLESLQSEDPTQEALEIARRQVAARLGGHQRPSSDGTTVVEMQGRAPHPDDPRISLMVARLGGSFVSWPRNTARMTLPEAVNGHDTDLISVRVALEDQALSWTQLIPFDPPHSVARDASLLRDYLGARGILSWIRDVLDDLIETDGGGAWDAESAPRPASRSQGGTMGLDLPTVEQVLRTWVRDPERLDTVDRILSAVETSHTHLEDEPDARAHLEAFSRSWRTLRAGLTGRAVNVR